MQLIFAKILDNIKLITNFTAIFMGFNKSWVLC